MSSTALTLAMVDLPKQSPSTEAKFMLRLINVSGGVLDPACLDKITVRRTAIYFSQLHFSQLPHLTLKYQQFPPSSFRAVEVLLSFPLLFLP